MTERPSPDMNMVNLGVLRNKGLMMTSIRKSTRMITEGIKGNMTTSFLMSEWPVVMKVIELIIRALKMGTEAQRAITERMQFKMLSIMRIMAIGIRKVEGKNDLQRKMMTNTI
jgi:limonene-1,2-epoxide hydrolase